MLEVDPPLTSESKKQREVLIEAFATVRESFLFEDLEAMVDSTVSLSAENLSLLSIINEIAEETKVVEKEVIQYR